MQLHLSYINVLFVRMTKFSGFRPCCNIFRKKKYLLQTIQIKWFESDTIILIEIHAQMF